MEQDLATLQLISNTLKEDPNASQRVLAKKTNVSLGMMNAILGRFAERGWIMLTNVNKRKFAYALTNEGMRELRERGKNFVEKTFKIANSYNQIMTEEVALAKKHGKTKVVLYGESYVKFLLEYACSKNKIEFEKVSELKEPEIKNNEYAIAGEMNDKETKEKLLKAGCTDILELRQSNSSEDQIF